MTYDPNPGASGGGGGTPGPQGDPGADGAPGVGVPTGGTTDQILAKASDADYDTEWVDLPSGGGGGSSLVINARTASYTLQASDAGKFVTVNVAPPTVATVTIPSGLPGSLAAPTEVLVGRRGDGSVLIAPGAGVTLIPDDSRRSLAVVGSMASLIHQGGDVWWITGALV